MAALVAIAASQPDTRSTVIDFTNSASPSSVQIISPFLGGCAVDYSGSLACVGNPKGARLPAVFDISNPATPAVKGSITSTLSGITAISGDGSYLVAADPKAWSLLISPLSLSRPDNRQAEVRDSDAVGWQMCQPWFQVYWDR